MTDQNCNGWTNYETWLVGLWFNDNIDEDMAETMDADVYRDIVTCAAQDEIQGAGGFVSDVLGAFLYSVNWAELSDSIRETHGFAEDDA